MIVCLNGKFLPDGKAHISIHDRGFLYGDGLYETMRVENGKPLFLAEHLERLRHGCRRLRLESGRSDRQLAALIQKTIDANKLKQAVLRLTLTRGPGPRGLDPRVCKTPTLLITAVPFTGFDAIFAAGGMSLALVSVRRNAANATPPEVKSIGCLNGVLAKIESLDLGAEEAALLDEHGNLAEGAVSNIFIVKNGVIATPALDGNQLPGVTRAAVCRLARRLRIPLRECVLGPEDLRLADEIFITNALMDIMPVRELVWKSRSKRQRRPFSAGPITQRLAENAL